MSSQNVENNKPKEDKEVSDVKPDKETLNTTDPQEHMEGPLSSLMHGVEDNLDQSENKSEENRKSDKT